jgi:hypothetical protein
VFEDYVVAVVSYTLFAVVEGDVVEQVDLAVGTPLDAVEAGAVLHVAPVVGVDVAVLPAELGRLEDPQAAALAPIRLCIQQIGLGVLALVKDPGVGDLGAGQVGRVENIQNQVMARNKGMLDIDGPPF